MRTRLQDLVCQYNRASNADNTDDVKLRDLKSHIVALRGDTPPCCFGEDDCSTTMLIGCSWSMDCGNEEDTDGQR